MDSELAAAIADVKVARSEAPVGVADARALFEKFVIAPHKAFHEALLPPSEFTEPFGRLELFALTHCACRRRVHCQ